MYDRPAECDWTAGSFMIARRSALEAVGGFEEDYFLDRQEPDVCLRLRRQGWTVQHRPELTVVHHGNEASDPRHAAQLAYAKRIYMRKHFSPPRRLGGLVALAVGYGIRALLGGRGGTGADSARTRAPRSPPWSGCATARSVPRPRPVDRALRGLEVGARMRVTAVAYFFPPVGGAGVQRNLRLVLDLGLARGRPRGARQGRLDRALGAAGTPVSPRKHPRASRCTGSTQSSRRLRRIVPDSSDLPGSTRIGRAGGGTGSSKRDLPPREAAI